MTASCDPDLYTKKVKFWDDVYGFKMSCMKEEVVKEAHVEVVNPSNIVCSPVVVKVIKESYITC